MHYQLVTLTFEQEAECTVWVLCEVGQSEEELQHLARKRLLALLGKHMEVVR